MGGWGGGDDLFSGPARALSWVAGLGRCERLSRNGLQTQKERDRPQGEANGHLFEIDKNRHRESLIEADARTVF